MFKLVTLLVLVIALIAGAFAQEERAPVAAAPAPSAPRRAGPPSPSAAPAATNAVSSWLSYSFFYEIGCRISSRDPPCGRVMEKGTPRALTSHASEGALVISRRKLDA